MDKAILSPIRKFRMALEKKGINVEKIILYGSHASDKADKQSDIDVMVISQYFKGMNALQRGETFGKILADIKIIAPIEPLGFTETEFQKKGRGTFIGDEVKAKGIEVN
jgi:uncharacterized protein